MHNEQTLLGCFVEGIYVFIRSTMRRWLVNDREVVHEDLAHKFQSLLDMQGGRRNSAERENQCTEAVRRDTKGPKGRRKPLRIMAIQNTATSPTSYKHASSVASSGHKL